MPGPDIQFWEQRFASGHMPWDRGTANPQLAAWIADGLFAAGERVIVPGCGAGHELVPLAARCCRVVGVDYSAAAVARARAALAAAGHDAEVVEADVLVWQPAAPAEIVYEQTCLCALHPDHWAGYAGQLERWIAPGGRLAALFMQSRKDVADEGWISGPPYHCDIHAMRALFGGARWQWPAPPYARVAHPAGAELAVLLTRR